MRPCFSLRKHVDPAPATRDRPDAPDDDLRARTQRLEDQAALKNLVDTFSNLADVKDIDRQILLFTEDATVESRTGDAPGIR